MATGTEVPKFDLNDPMPEDYRKLLVKLCCVEHGIEMISRSAILDFLTQVWMVGMYQAPSPFERVRTASYVWQEVGHSELFYNIASDLDPVLANEDIPVTQYAFHMKFPTWTELAAVNFLTDRVGMYQANEWVGSSYVVLAKHAPMVVKDERGHTTMGYERLERVCETESGREEAQRAINRWYPAALDMFGRSESKRQHEYIKWGLKKRSNAQLRRQYIDDVNPLIARLGLDVPDENKNRRFF
ncbi:MAG: hypothetical protein A3H27_10890 [Acidobacteria bacterium RIFCSPLOWO2_02_FULL_59_13]|nr:MAG: hypothetical protein A3H27_10890 [Acidobacteria bacterium RIFCSPLOWO2_02_FULL_59_13]